MADDNKKTTSLITTFRPTTVGKPKPDTSFTITKPAKRLFKMEAGEAKVPRKRQGVDSKYETEYAFFNEMEAPTTVYVVLADDGSQIQVEWDETYQNEDGSTGIWHDADGNLYDKDASQVMEGGYVDERNITGTPEAMVQLQNAITWFNNRNRDKGIRLAKRFVAAKRDKTGRTVEQTEAVFRTR